MLDSVLLASSLGQGRCYGRPGADWRGLVYMDKSYAAYLLPRLAEPVRLVPRVVADESPHINRVIQYEPKGVEVEEVAEPAPESRQFACRVLPFLEVVNALKEHIRKLRQGASCRGRESTEAHEPSAGPSLEPPSGSPIEPSPSQE